MESQCYTSALWRRAVRRAASRPQCVRCIDIHRERQSTPPRNPLVEAKGACSLPRPGDTGLVARPPLLVHPFSFVLLARFLLSVAPSRTTPTGHMFTNNATPRVHLEKPTNLGNRASAIRQLVLIHPSLFSISFLILERSTLYYLKFVDSVR